MRWSLCPFHGESQVEGQGQALVRYPPQSSRHHDGDAVTNGLGLSQVMGRQEGPVLCVFNGCLDHLPEVSPKSAPLKKERKKKSTGKKEMEGKFYRQNTVYKSYLDLNSKTKQGM